MGLQKKILDAAAGFTGAKKDLRVHVKEKASDLVSGPVVSSLVLLNQALRDGLKGAKQESASGKLRGGPLRNGVRNTWAAGTFGVRVLRRFGEVAVGPK
jgi:hypothetical protein